MTSELNKDNLYRNEMSPQRYFKTRVVDNNNKVYIEFPV